MRTTSGFTLAYVATVRKFSATSPSATRARRTTAILRYVFITSAEPYSSTNCRFAPSSVLGLMSATVGFMAYLNTCTSNSFHTIQSTPHARPTSSAMPNATKSSRVNPVEARSSSKRRSLPNRWDIHCLSTPAEQISGIQRSRQDALASGAGEDGTRERGNENDPNAERNYDRNGLKAVDPELGRCHRRRQRCHVTQDEPFENHQERNRDDRDERVLDEIGRAHV